MNFTSITTARFRFGLVLAASFFALNAAAQPVKQTPADAPTVIRPTHFDTSPEMRSIPADADAGQSLRISREHNVPEGLNRLPEGWKGTFGTRHTAHVDQTTLGSRIAMPAPIVNSEGLGSGFLGYPLTGVPPDTTGGVGLDYYMQWVNRDFLLFNKDGTVVERDGNDWRSGNSIWYGFGGPCQVRNDGDPIVLYDQISGRWIMTQFALPNYPEGPYYQCTAVSTTGDPLGSWHRYSYEWPSAWLNDYPKLGVWTDGYYLTANQFDLTSSSSWRGVGVAVFERDQMLQGSSAQVLYWNLGPGYASVLPADLDGNEPPPAGSPAYLLAVADSTTDWLRIWEVSVNWQDPASSTCGDAGNDPTSSVQLTNFTYTSGIDQPNTSHDLDALSPRLMFRAPYRNFGDHEAVVLTHTVNNPAGLRWYELRDPGGTPVLYQEGTYSPDADARWMGSIAMDQDGNIALGYSVSGAAVSPSIRVTGRLADDPPGQMTFTEHEIQTGSGFQSPPPGESRNRWGDYSTMSIDPSDDCTFWYTHEYIASTGSFIWRTRVAAFGFDSCGVLPDELFNDGFESGDTDEWLRVVP